MKIAVAAWQAMSEEEKSHLQAKAEELHAQKQHALLPQAPLKPPKKDQSRLPRTRRRELTPLNIFVKERYNSVLDEKFQDRLKTLGTAWKALTTEERQRYQEAADVENTKHREEGAAKPVSLSPNPLPLSEPKTSQSPPGPHINRPPRVRIVSALNMFFKEQFALLGEKHPYRFKVLHVAWKTLVPEERQRYKEAAKSECAKRMAETTNNLGIPSFDAGIEPEGAADISGPKKHTLSPLLPPTS